MTFATTVATTVAAVSQAGAAEAVVFWILAPVAVLAAIGMVAVRKAVHSALLLALVMLCLAVFYLTQDAVFLGVVQVVVYTGAIMMLFLFVLMLVGVDSSDSLVETLRGQRWAAIAAGLGFGALVVAGLGRVVFPRVVGLGQANAGGNVSALAELIFTRYVWAFEVTSALLITAALGAMVLAHRERTEPRKGQRELAEERFRNFAARGGRVSPLPNPGVYARHNAVDMPALLPDGRPAENSVPGAVAARTGVGQVAGAQLRRPGAAGELEEGGGR
ncbi:NADH-quinone oxidoreductase subunit J [Carbonactinospora thermoautotrophica]|uniref:NADH-quinone oxidoreductase subunit J n=1 Tax=Carbonactinospora thermoautotrophica TaxID=1469144 RepID=UPI000830C530|nr:NADH-quinone oxidoreductase subunit J [Carbonactinospora thermoautotrophica]